MDDLIKYFIQYQSHNVFFEGAIYYNMVKEAGGKGCLQARQFSLLTFLPNDLLPNETVFPADLFTQ